VPSLQQLHNDSNDTPPVIEILANEVNAGWQSWPGGERVGMGLGLSFDHYYFFAEKTGIPSLPAEAKQSKAKQSTAQRRLRLLYSYPGRYSVPYYSFAHTCNLLS